MAKAKMLEQDGMIEINESDVDDVTDLENDADLEMQTAFSEFGAGPNDKQWLIKVYKVDERAGRISWMFDCVPAELPILNRIRDDFGPGLYEARMYYDKKLKRKPKFSIAAPAKKPDSFVAPQTDLAAVLKVMQENQERQFVQLKEVLLQSTGKQVTPSDPMSMMRSMMETMVSMREFISPPQPQTNGIEMLLKGMEIMKDMGDSGRGETSVLDLVRDVIKSDVFSQAVGATLIAPKTASASPTPQIKMAKPLEPQQTQPINKDESSMVEQNHLMNSYINMLLERAKRDSDPTLYAEYIIDNMPESVIRAQLLDPGVIDQAAQINPEVETYRSWFVDLQNNLRIMLDGPDDDEQPSIITPSPSP